MKICPQCQNTYTDDSLQFCLQDGTRLNAVQPSSFNNPTESWNEPETVVRQQPAQVRIDVPPAAPVTTPQFSNEPPTKSSKAPLVILGLLLLALLGGIGAAAVWFVLNQQKNPVAQTSQTPNPAPANANANATETATPTPTPTPKPTLKPAEIEAAKKEAESVIYGWKTAAEDHNLDANLSNYADAVDYYKGGKINRSKLRASKEPAYKKYDTIEINISEMNVTVDPTGEKATAVFDKEWNFEGVDKDGNDVFNSGKVQQQLILGKVNGKWKIIAEKDLKVY
jgi:hypothetical protein